MCGSGEESASPPRRLQVSHILQTRPKLSSELKTQVEFRSSKFPPYEGEQERINPGLWGKRLAEYLVQKLSDRGIKTEENIAGDWGYDSN